MAFVMSITFSIEVKLVELSYAGNIQIYNILLDEM